MTTVFPTVVIRPTGKQASGGATVYEYPITFACTSCGTDVLSNPKYHGECLNCGQRHNIIEEDDQ